MAVDASTAHADNSSCCWETPIRPAGGEEAVRSFPPRNCHYSLAPASLTCESCHLDQSDPPFVFRPPLSPCCFERLFLGLLTYHSAASYMYPQTVAASSSTSGCHGNRTHPGRTLPFTAAPKLMPSANARAIQPPSAVLGLVEASSGVVFVRHSLSD